MGNRGGIEEAKRVLGDNVKKYRLASGLSIRKFAILAEIEPSQVARVENAETNTSVSTIWLIAKALGIQPSQLLEK